MTPGILIVGGQHQTIAPLDGQPQLQCIYAIEPQPVAKERRLRLDILRGQAFQIQAIDDQLF